MFPWNIAKSAEAMFSRWAIKKVCKFLLKKKLGQLILGDIDLNQLDVQLSAGTIQLSDLALNVDYINQKFGAAATVTVKEGSIGSLLVSMPWKGKGCQIEVDELELVLAPSLGNISQVGSETCNSTQNGNSCIRQDLGTLEKEMVDNTVTSASVDVHEGVKTIAKMVKWLLTSFHVKIKKLIVAFDPSIGESKDKGYCKTLVLRITEVECGTDISDDVNSNFHAMVDNFLGLSRLTNFVKFQGAILEFLQIDGDDNQSPLPCDLETKLGLGCCQSNATTPIVTGETGGFSGTLKLSIPWKNGSLDIRKVDTDVYIDPLQLRFQPSSIKCFLYLWDIFKDMGKNGKDLMQYKATESVYFNASSHCHSSTLGSCVFATDKLSPNHESFSVDTCSTMGKETVTDDLLPASQLISDWVPSSIGRNQRYRTEEEPDFGASVDQFFECFDGLRNSQSTLGNSGMWNWTCSVFSAITAASNLASGSLHIPSEQKHVETNFKATIAGISLLFSFIDEDQMHSCDPKGDKSNAGSYVHYMGVKSKDILFVLQVCPREMNFEATVEHIELTDHFSAGNTVMDVSLHGFNDNVESQVDLIKKLQAAVLGAFPPCSSSTKDADIEKTREPVAADVTFGKRSMERCICGRNCRSIYRDDVVKVTLLRTSGVSQCQFTITSGSSGDCYTGPISFSLKLPPFVFWVNFHLISMALDLFKEIGNSLEKTSTKNVFASEAFDKYRSSSQGDVKSSCPHVTTLSCEESLRGNIFLPNARVIFCFPFEKDGDFRSYSSWDQFIALDFSSPSTLSEEKVPANYPNRSANFKKRYSLTTLRSLHLNVGNLAIYLITPASKDNVERKSCGMPRLIFFAQNILTVTDGTDRLSVFSMLWQEGPVTGPWIAKKAKLLLATSEDLGSRQKFMGKGFEFASVNTVKDMEDFNTRTRDEMILSSAFFLHAHLSSVIIKLGSSQYKHLQSLLQQVVDWCSCISSDPVATREESSVSQTSILMEFDYVEIQATMAVAESIKNSLQNELPGTWDGLKLQIRKFELLSVSNIGGIRGANFLRVAHGKGNLWGSITGVPGKEFLLISCSDSTTGRGDGEGSNVLSSRFSGSDIVHLWDPEKFLTHTSITIRSGTIVAIGGRLDWFDTIPSFFNLLSPETEQAGDNSVQKRDSERNVPCGSSFILNLVDIGLSYEPYVNNLAVGKGFDSESSSSNANGKMGEQYVACLLAASSLKLSNTTVADSIDREYKIRVQDLGLLLCAASVLKNDSDAYSVEHLRKIGYVKVAQEAHVEALLRMNCKNGHLWEVECSESHIVLNTCHDTASGLICLANQLQQLFAPDVEESVVHLQNRWNNVQQTQESDGTTISNSDSEPSTSQVHSSSADAKSKPAVNLMDEICEDAFCFDANWDGQSDFCQSKLHLFNDSLLGEVSNFSTLGPETLSHNLSFTGSVPVIRLENSRTSFSQNSFPEFIEGYFLSDLRPLSELSVNNHSSNDILKCKSKNVKGGEVRRGNNGWYGNSSFKILENHVSEVSKHNIPQQLVQGEAPCNHTRSDECGKVRGRVLLKNINVMWRLYAGSDWHNFQKDVQPPSVMYGRDRTVCLELALSGIGCQYDIFPDGEIFVSKLSLSVQDIRLNDNSNDAPWKLVLGYYQSKDHPREYSSKALKMDLEAVRPHPSIPLEEYRLRIAFLPMLLHLHQHQLDFLISFFGGKSSTDDQSPISPQGLGESRMLPRKSTNLGGHNITEEAMLPYFQKFDIWPVLVRVDYSPSRVDLAALRGGKYVELVNLVPWKGVELQLKHVQAVGVYGWSCVCETIIGEWLEDISQNQIHKLLKGLTPIRSIVAVGSGAAKLVSLPVKNYRKDHRVLKGMQRGTIAFLRSISLEAIGLGVHLAAGAHDILLQAECILTSIPPSVPWPVQSRVNTTVRSNQPKDARQGIQQAYDSISDGLGKSASALVQTPLKRYQRGAGVGSALVTAVQAAPAAAIAPASATARAVHCALLGVRNSLDPERKKESMDKYLGTTQPREFI